MSEQVNNILADLFALDPSLREQDSLLRPLVEGLLQNKPAVSMDPSFKASLGRVLDAKATQLMALREATAGASGAESGLVKSSSLFGWQVVLPVLAMMVLMAYAGTEYLGGKPVRLAIAPEADFAATESAPVPMSAPVADPVDTGVIRDTRTFTPEGGISEMTVKTEPRVVTIHEPASEPVIIAAAPKDKTAKKDPVTTSTKADDPETGKGSGSTADDTKQTDSGTNTTASTAGDTGSSADTPPAQSFGTGISSSFRVEYIMVETPQPLETVDASESVMATGTARQVFQDGEFAIRATKPDKPDYLIAETMAVATSTEEGTVWQSGLWVPFSASLDLSESNVCEVDLHFYSGEYEEDERALKTIRIKLSDIEKCEDD